jgi:plasmid stability protein
MRNGPATAIFGVDLLARWYFSYVMETVTLKMDKRHVKLLRERARALGRSQAAVVRELIDEHLASKKRPSLHDLAGNVCGSISGPRDMSTRKPTAYGRD